MGGCLSLPNLAAVSQPPLGIYASPVEYGPFFKSPQSVAALKHGILQRYVVVLASKSRSNRGGGVISSMDMPGRYETGDSDVAWSVGSGSGHAHLQDRIRGG